MADPVCCYDQDVNEKYECCKVGIKPELNTIVNNLPETSTSNEPQDS